METNIVKLYKDVQADLIKAVGTPAEKRYRISADTLADGYTYDAIIIDGAAVVAVPHSAWLINSEKLARLYFPTFNKLINYDAPAAYPRQTIEYSGKGLEKMVFDVGDKPLHVSTKVLKPFLKGIRAWEYSYTSNGHTVQLWDFSTGRFVGLVLPVKWVD